MSEENDKSARNRFIRQTVIGVGAAVVTLPLGYALWKYPSFRARLYPTTFRRPGAPPPRRSVTQSSAFEPSVSSANGSSSLQLSDSGRIIQDYTGGGITSFFPTREEITQTTAWLAIRSFLIATAGVTIAFGTGTLYLVWKWDIQNMDDFHQQMRDHIQAVLPSLVQSRISTAEMIKETVSQEAVDSWTWDGAKERLNEAYNKSPEAWMATAMREMELSYQKELQQKNDSERRGK
ncbi:hypothetical protein FRC14_006730 [Serendipita sp. 396]|nr:hypothetical protein FRC14_006730 [Serendipita sp. 396]KAG8795561.1 hypothetical protein FRC16_010040 [Serendipita sp. 398]KAG8828692.1 hypothetical protein FRC19_000080 [Serendipita sp. 401]KAG9058857.1 hypothetical protein FS842_000054 [Serendipita sp. 407]